MSPWTPYGAGIPARVGVFRLTVHAFEAEMATAAVAVTSQEADRASRPSRPVQVTAAYGLMYGCAVLKSISA